MFPDFISQSLLFSSFIVATFAPLVVWKIKDYGIRKIVLITVHYAKLHLNYPTTMWVGENRIKRFSSAVN